ncbi:MAG TPA: peptidylprolyl isomerase [Marmoricola sp.]|nr:peptidylprolyl isomerase [Marmoricola sp.]
MSTRTILVSVAAAVAALALLTACGSSSTAPQKTTASALPTQPALQLTYSTGTRCVYPVSAAPAAKTVHAPTPKPIDSVRQATLSTNQGTIEIALNTQTTPCTVNSFASLILQKYFNDTPCHRLTTANIYVLQCGDPSGSGSGGPGYEFKDELVKAAKPKDCTAQGCVYPAGTVAMANAGPGTNGSQFFLVYQDSPLAYSYTIFGHMSAESLAVVKKIASYGTNNMNGDGDGGPNEQVTIEAAIVQ